MSDDDLRALIRNAFHGVTLEDGMSIRQGEICDNYGKDSRGKEVSEAKFAAIPLDEVTGDWAAIPLAELERYPQLAYLDAKGFRYYIPAFLLSLLESSDRCSMRAICTLGSVCPTRDLWAHHMEHYELLDEKQRAAIALFLFHFQEHPALDEDDRQQVYLGLESFWQQYLS